MVDVEDNPMAELITTVVTSGKNIITAAEKVIETTLPTIGYTVTGVIAIWGIKSATINIIEIIDRIIDIKKN